MKTSKLINYLTEAAKVLWYPHNYYQISKIDAPNTQSKSGEKQRVRGFLALRSIGRGFH